jgi:hypothetical protein
MISVYFHTTPRHPGEFGATVTSGGDDHDCIVDLVLETRHQARLADVHLFMSRDQAIALAAAIAGYYHLLLEDDHREM